MPNHIISCGQIVSGINLNAEDSMMILEGGIALNTTVNEHGKLIICSGGLAKDTTVSSNGEISVSSGGKAVNTTLHNVDFLFARGESRVAQTELVKAPSSSLVPASASPVVKLHEDDCEPVARSVVAYNNYPIEADLSKFNAIDPKTIYSLVNKLCPGFPLSDQIHLMALIHAINSNGESIASKELLVSFGYDGSPGQFSYCGRVVRAFNQLGYHLFIANNSDRNREDVQNAGIDGFNYRYPTPVKIYNHLMQQATNGYYCSLSAQDISHLVSFLYTVATNEPMPQREYMSFEHGPTEGQYKYYHRSLRPLYSLGYHVMVVKG